jgi:hypothetical protein
MKRNWFKFSPASWSDELDFIGPRVRTSVLGWALLALGLVAVLRANDLAEASQQSLAEAQSLIKRLERGSRQVAVQEKAVAAVVQAHQDEVPALDDAGWHHAAQLAQWLGFDWARTLDQVDAASDGDHAVLTQFNLDLATLASGPDTQPELKVQAAVRDDVNALRWMELLGPNASLRTRDRLTAPFVTRHGDYAWRVDVVIEGGQP